MMSWSAISASWLPLSRLLTSAMGRRFDNDHGVCGLISCVTNLPDEHN
jgi:hypothetical protein